MATFLLLGNGIIHRLHQPEYTGENRCLPCTIINVVIATVVSGAISTILPAVSLFVFASFLAIIYLRGYLVPGTPRLTEQYLPGRIHSLIKTTTTNQPHPLDHGETIDIEGVLTDANVLTECVRGSDLCLKDSFRDAWKSRIQSLRTTDTANDNLATIVGVEPEEITLHDRGISYVAIRDGQWIGQWESRAAFIADIAAAKELEVPYDAWSSYSFEQQCLILAGIRVFLTQCPACDGPVSLEKDQVKSCCRPIDVIAVSCNECNARLFETDDLNSSRQ